MRLKTMKLIAVVMLLMNTLFTLPALADSVQPVSQYANIYHGIEGITEYFILGQFSVKKGQPYDASNDPAIKTRAGGPEETSPQHGYFAVPLIVIGLAGILLYFSKFD